MQQFTDKAKVALQKAAKAAKDLHQSYIGSEHILVGLVREKTGVAAKVLAENGVQESQLISMIKDLIAPEGNLAIMERDGYSPRATKVLEDSHRLAAKYKSKMTGTEHILLALLREGENVGLRLLNTIGINVQKVYMDTLIAMGEDINQHKDDLAKSRNKKKKDGVTITLNQYSRDLTYLAREGKLDPVIGRDMEIMRVVQILSRRTKNNPCLIGEPGVGKTAIAEGLALRIVNGEVPDTVKNKRVVTLDLAGMVAGSKYRGEFEERIKRVIKEVIDAGNIYLFLDEIHTLIGAGGAEGAIDASNILKPSLSRGEIQLIGATTISEYRKYIEKDAALERRFQPVMVEEPTEQEAIEILAGVAYKYEEHHKVTITPEALEAAVKLSNRYINDRNLPDKAIDLIDEASASIRLKNMHIPDNLKEMTEQIKKFDLQIERSIRMEAYTQAAELRQNQEALMKKYDKTLSKYEKTQAEKNLVVTDNDIAEVVANWTKIPVKKLTQKESDRLLKLESILHKRVIGQEESVKAVAQTMKRGRVGLQDPNRPIGSFLFLGPTGVGKTELSKALAEAMFGSENALIRVDMSEYMESHSVSKMVGSPPGYVGFEEGGQLSEKVRRNPYSVVLFDEIEKAHPDVFNILLQVLDDGHITDSKGRKVSFKNTVLIMTSNAGAQRIVDPKNLGFAVQKDAKADYEKMKSNVMDEVKRLFKPEFINRIDEIMVFHPLTEQDMKQIITLLSKNLCDRCKEQMEIELSFTNTLKEYLIKKHADLKMGARPLKRAIQNVVENELATAILEGRVKRGDTVSVGVRNDKVTFTVKDKETQ
ncbi:MAG: ATP-dependent Clp protease ATP-binding subunit [Lachnospiraceae bacterium]|jgi:ATPases with chaperone activity, ATP-binding subunit|nr:ATP-dependent Clp protease ATP-binding subunit [Lachnospiraceae bacterium]MCI9398822.1 ATP-dependent Clp protease ATP-binding subunit [Lachnospiraceae bacterium]MCX4376999.1 ATP-dependent Clp protease ATP-binding subunit [Lachnospiraceae bacterium]